MTSAYTPELVHLKNKKQREGIEYKVKCIRYVLSWDLNIYCLRPETDFLLKGNFTKKIENDILVTLLINILSSFYLAFQGLSDFYSSRFIFFLSLTSSVT